MWWLALLAAGQVWVVDDDGPGDFTTLDAAVAAAAEGDAILVRAGTYTSFSVDGKSLSLHFEPGSVAGVMQVRNLAASQRVLVQGMTSSGRAILDDCEGSVWLEGCTINAFAACEIASCDSVVLADCAIDSDVAGFPFVPSAGITITASTVHVYDSVFGGAVGRGGSHSIFCADGTADGGAGMRVESGFAFASGSTFEGGPGGFGDDQGLMFNGNGTDGGAGVEVEAGAEVDLVACTLIGGPGGVGTTGCEDGDPGLPLDDPGGVVTQVRGIARSLDGPGFLQEGDLADLVFTGAPGDLVLGLASIGTASLAVPGFLGPLQVSFPWVLVTVGTLPPTGELLLQLTVGNLPAGVLYLTRYLQPVMVSSGGALYLGAPTAFTSFDDVY